jgi:acyl-CoA reductase-like NAD-dependent aldehyde dehydrogenase
MQIASLPAPLDALPPEEQTHLESRLRPARFAKGERIFRARDAGDGCYIIDHGEVRLEIDRPELDTEGVLGYLKPGSLLGELALIDRQPRSASAYAETDVEARFLSTDELDALARDEPAIAATLLWALARDVAQKLRATTERLSDHILPEGEDRDVEDMVARARQALALFEEWDEQRVDELLLRIASVVAREAESLARQTVEETHLGNVPDKTLKNHVASLGVYQQLVGKIGAGEISRDDALGLREIASPAGVIFGIVPVTNPVATAIFKVLVALKSRNALILSFHRGALGVGNRVGDLIQAELEGAGAPAGLVQWIRSRTSRKQTARFMSHPDVSLILATGGAGMVKAAYSSGTPALGVGPGNAPCWVTASADLESAAEAVVLSKSFDNGLICGAEHNLVVDASVRDRFVEELEKAGAAVLDETESAAFEAAAVREGMFRPEMIGQSAERIAGMLRITRDHPIRLIVVPRAAVEPGDPFSDEKMTPVLSLFTARDEEHGLELCRQVLAVKGAGHTAAIHTTDDALLARFSRHVPASRIIVNSSAVHGVVGMTTALEPSFTLGCGTFGKNSTTDNVGYRNLRNVKRVAHHLETGTALWS